MCAQTDRHFLPFHDTINSCTSHTTRLTCKSKKLPSQHGELNVTTTQLKGKQATRCAAAALTAVHLAQLLKLAVRLPLRRHIGCCSWLTHSPAVCDSLQANYRRAYSQFRWVWPFALGPALRWPLYLHLDRQKAELWYRPYFGRFSAATRNRHNLLPCPGWFFSASWIRRLNRSYRTAWSWASNASDSRMRHASVWVLQQSAHLSVFL
jgi:hypothetical protein